MFFCSTNQSLKNPRIDQHQQTANHPEHNSAHCHWLQTNNTYTDMTKPVSVQWAWIHLKLDFTQLKQLTQHKHTVCMTLNAHKNLPRNIKTKFLHKNYHSIAILLDPDVPDEECRNHKHTHTY